MWVRGGRELGVGMFTVLYYGDIHLIGQALDGDRTPIHNLSIFIIKPFNGDRTGTQMDVLW